MGSILQALRVHGRLKISRPLHSATKGVPGHRAWTAYPQRHTRLPIWPWSWDSAFVESTFAMRRGPASSALHKLTSCLTLQPQAVNLEQIYMASDGDHWFGTVLQLNPLQVAFEDLQTFTNILFRQTIIGWVTFLSVTLQGPRVIRH